MTAIIDLPPNYVKKDFEVPELVKELRGKSGFEEIISAVGNLALLKPETAPKIIDVGRLDSEPLNRMMAEYNRQFPLDDYQRRHYSPIEFNY